MRACARKHTKTAHKQGGRGEASPGYTTTDRPRFSHLEAPHRVANVPLHLATGRDANVVSVPLLHHMRRRTSAKTNFNHFARA